MAKYARFDGDFTLKGKTAVLTGGANGIGYETAKLFHQKGARVVVWDWDENVESAAGEIDPSIRGIRVDVRDLAGLEDAADRTGEIDILVSLAAVGFVAPALEVAPGQWERVLQINLTGLFRTCQVVGRRMIAAGNGGKIINIASQAGIVALPDHVAYAASKAGVLAVTRALAYEWGPYGINVNAVSPTVIETPMSDVKTGFWSGERGRKHLEIMPSGRFGKPDEVAAAILFLASGGANLINGANLVIDGGYTIA